MNDIFLKNNAIKNAELLANEMKEEYYVIFCKNLFNYFCMSAREYDILLKYNRIDKGLYVVVKKISGGESNENKNEQGENIGGIEGKEGMEEKGEEEGGMEEEGKGEGGMEEEGKGEEGEREEGKEEKGKKSEGKIGVKKKKVKKKKVKRVNILDEFKKITGKGKKRKK